VLLTLVTPFLLFLSSCEGKGHTNGRTKCTRSFKNCGDPCLVGEGKTREQGLCSKNEECVRGHLFMQSQNICTEPDEVDPCWGDAGTRKERKAACKQRSKTNTACRWNGMRQICNTTPAKKIDECQEAKTSEDCKTLFKQEGFEYCRWNKVDERCYDSKWDCSNALDQPMCRRFAKKVNPNCLWVARLMPSTSKGKKMYCKDMLYDLSRTTPINQVDPDCAEHDFRRCGKDERCFWDKVGKSCY